MFKVLSVLKDNGNLATPPVLVPFRYPDCLSSCNHTELSDPRDEICLYHGIFDSSGSISNMPQYTKNTQMKLAVDLLQIAAAWVQGMFVVEKPIVLIPIAAFHVKDYHNNVKGRDAKRKLALVFIASILYNGKR